MSETEFTKLDYELGLKVKDIVLTGLDERSDNLSKGK